MKQALCMTALALVLAAPALAMQECTPAKEDSRIRYCKYSPAQIYHLWTAPGGIMTIQFADNESVPEGNVAATDGSRLERKARGNFLYLKSTSKGGDTPCMIPEPLLITTKLADGRLRPYHFQIETKPNDCSKTPVERPKSEPPMSMVSTAEAAASPAHVGNLRYVDTNGLAAGADVFYSAIFQYPADDAAKRAAWARQRAIEAQRQEANLLLKQQTSWPYGNQFDGSWNFRYVAHGSLSPAPTTVRDNGYETVFLFPQMQRVPALFRLQPGATRCNREHDDHNEATEIPSMHRSGSDGDTMIASGVAQGWCMRDGKTVLEILNFAYRPTGATPATGTVSPYVTRTLKHDAEPEPERPPPVPLEPQHSQEAPPPQQDPMLVQPAAVREGANDGR